MCWVNLDTLSSFYSIMTQYVSPDTLSPFCVLCYPSLFGSGGTQPRSSFFLLPREPVVIVSFSSQLLLT